jgi:hypothetical protein
MGKIRQTACLRARPASGRGAISNVGVALVAQALSPEDFDLLTAVIEFWKYLTSPQPESTWHSTGRAVSRQTEELAGN